MTAIDDVYGTDLRPDPIDLDTHHVIPLTWGGPDIGTNLVRISPSTHRRIHVGLDACVAAGGPEHVVQPRRYGKCWKLIVRGWEGADPSKRHRTL